MYVFMTGYGVFSWLGDCMLVDSQRVDVLDSGDLEENYALVDDLSRNLRKIPVTISTLG